MRRIFAIVGVALLAAACADPGPSQEAIASAEHALRKARDEGSGQGGAALMRNAEEKLSRARAAQRKKDYDEAQHLAEQVALDAQLADALARNQEARERLAEAQKVLEELRGEAERRRLP